MSGRPLRRRSFLQYAGATAGAAALVLAGCTQDDENLAASPGLVLGTGDVGLLNYLYAFKQLEAAFYAQVRGATVQGLASAELNYLTQIAAHEAIHRDFLRAVLNRDAGGRALPALTFDFSGLDFGQRGTVLAQAQAFEDLGVAACNGVAQHFGTEAYVLLLSQLASVEARHAAYIRDLRTPGSFAADDVVDGDGLEPAAAPRNVLNTIQPYLKTKLNVDSLGL